MTTFNRVQALVRVKRIRSLIKQSAALIKLNKQFFRNGSYKRYQEKNAAVHERKYSVQALSERIGWPQLHESTQLWAKLWDQVFRPYPQRNENRGVGPSLWSGRVLHNAWGILRVKGVLKLQEKGEMSSISCVIFSIDSDCGSCEDQGWPDLHSWWLDLLNFFEEVFWAKGCRVWGIHPVFPWKLCKIWQEKGLWTIRGYIMWNIYYYISEPQRSCRLLFLQTLPESYSQHSNYFKQVSRIVG